MYTSASRDRSEPLFFGRRASRMVSWCLRRQLTRCDGEGALEQVASDAVAGSFWRFELGALSRRPRVLGCHDVVLWRRDGRWHRTGLGHGLTYAVRVWKCDSAGYDCNLTPNGKYLGIFGESLSPPRSQFPFSALALRFSISLPGFNTGLSHFATPKARALICPRALAVECTPLVIGQGVSSCHSCKSSRGSDRY